MKITPIVYAIHEEGESPIFGDGTIRVEAMDKTDGFYYKITQVNPQSEFIDCYDREEILRILEAIELLEKGDSDD